MAIVLGAAVPVSRVLADDVPDDTIAQVKDKCFYIQSSLRSLHTSDALLRVNVGQLYESVATKLMDPLNARAGLNRYDSLQLVGSAKDYETQLDTFRHSYSIYESAMSRTIGLDCKSKPLDFYTALSETRLDREKVHQDAVVLLSIAEQYSTQVTDLKGKIANE
jgi:hypothetical protein